MKDLGEVAKVICRRLCWALGCLRKADREVYGERKERINITVTPTAQTLLEQQAILLGISWSELIEQFARGLLSSEPETRSLGGVLRQLIVRADSQLANLEDELSQLEVTRRKLEQAREDALRDRDQLRSLLENLQQ